MMQPLITSPHAIFSRRARPCSAHRMGPKPRGGRRGCAVTAAAICRAPHSSAAEAGRCAVNEAGLWEGKGQSQAAVAGALSLPLLQAPRVTPGTRSLCCVVCKRGHASSLGAASGSSPSVHPPAGAGCSVPAVPPVPARGCPNPLPLAGSALATGLEEKPPPAHLSLLPAKTTGLCATPASPVLPLQTQGPRGEVRVWAEVSTSLVHPRFGACQPSPIAGGRSPCSGVLLAG